MRLALTRNVRRALLALLPFAVFSPLLAPYGLFEQGDANFPWRPFKIDDILPWNATASAGADNVFVGVPRLAYHLGIDVCIVVAHNLQVAQWLWYSSIMWLGLTGAYLLARRLGAGALSAPLAIFYAFNLWSYDRVAQGPIVLSYEALPLVVYLFIRYLAQRRPSQALFFACSVLLLIPSLQLSYIGALVCIGLAVRALFRQRRVAIVPLALAALLVVAANGFYVFSMVADALGNRENGIALVNARFGLGIFQHYAANVSVLNTLRLASFFYTSYARQPAVVQWLCWLPPLLLVLLVALRRTFARPAFSYGLLLVLCGLWLVDGIAVAPSLYATFRRLVPGMSSFVEPDYYTPAYILGAFVMLASGARFARRAYGRAWTWAAWIVACAGVFPFLPVAGPHSGFPQTPQPQPYVALSRASVPGNLLILPTKWGSQYRWSSYTLNAFPMLAAPADYFGPAMQEWVSPGTMRVETRLADAFEAGEPAIVEALMPRLGIGTVEIDADSLGPNLEWPNAEVDDALWTFWDLKRTGFLRLRADARDGVARVVTGTTRAPPLAVVGIYGEPVAASGAAAPLWLALAQSRDGTYAPIVGGTASRAPLLVMRRISPGEIESIGSCTHVGPLTRVARSARSVTFGSQSDIECATVVLAPLHEMAFVQIRVAATPSGVVAPLLAFSGSKHAAVFEPVDATDDAPHEIPPWAQRAVLLVRVPAGERVTLRGVRLGWLPRRAALRAEAPRTCVVSDASFVRANVMHYRVSATLEGTCTLVLRQSFSPLWRLRVRSGSWREIAHREIDGYANGWIGVASGPVRADLVYALAAPYVAGMCCTIVCLLAAFACFVVPRVARRFPRT